MHLYGNNISADCEYCKNGRLLCNEVEVVCKKYGYIRRKYSCRKFTYDPIKRKPLKAVLNTDFDESDFRID